MALEPRNQRNQNPNRDENMLEDEEIGQKGGEVGSEFDDTQELEDIDIASDEEYDQRTQR